MKKFCLIVLSFLLVLTVTACGKEQDGGSSGGGIFSKSLKASDLNIDDFPWETKEAKCDYGYDCYSFSLTNNSKYDVIGVDVTYGVKDGVSESDLSMFSAFMKDHDGYIKEDDSPKDVTLRDTKNALVAKGETVTGLHLTVGFKDYSWYDYPTKEQYEVMTIKEIQLGIVSDGYLYVAYYDFAKKTWTLDEEKKEVDKWTNKDIGKKLPNPNAAHFITVYDDSDDFKIFAYGVDSDKFDEYVKVLKEAGFEEEEYRSTHYEGKSADGYEVTVWFEKSEGTLSIEIEPTDD